MSSVSLQAAFDKMAARRSVVSIKTQVTDAAYEPVSKWQGTGFVASLNKGFIITNQHVTGYACVAIYEVTFYNGQKLPARLLYRDPWHDFAVLEVVEPQKMPSGVRELKDFRAPQLNESVYMMGNNQGQGFSFQKGEVNNLFQDLGTMPSSSFSFLLNSRGGSSGSPLLSEKREVVGLNYAGNNRGIGFSLHVQGVRKALEALKKNKRPLRYHTGMIVRLTPLQEVMEHHRFPFHIAKDYIKKHPYADSRLLKVIATLKGSPAEKAGIIAGDVVWSVEGHPIGPSNEKMEDLLNKSRGRAIRLGIYREGRFVEKRVGTYNLHATVVNRLLVFGGATFFEANDIMRWRFGVGPKALMTYNVMANSAFGRAMVPSGAFQKDLSGGSSVRLCYIQDAHLDDWIANVPLWVKKRIFPVAVEWLGVVESGFADHFFCNRRVDFCNIHYNTSENALPKVLDFSFKNRTWVVSAILCHGG